MTISNSDESSGKDDSPPSPDPPAASPATQETSSENRSNRSETASNDSLRKYVSKIVPPSPSRVQKGTNTPTKTTSPSTMGVRNDAMYERSKLRLAAKERHLREAEQKLMEECTFTPETNKSRSSSNSGNTTVFDRLYSDSKKTTPKKANGRHNGERKSPTSVSSHGSSRIDYLYQDGLRKAQNRRLTDKEEAEARRRRLEEKELEHCTFRPNMDWRKKKHTNSNRRSGMPTRARTIQYDYSPPVQVVTTQPLSTRANGGLRKSERNRSTVSPLRSPDIPKRAVIPSGVASVGDDTEYGSI